MTKLAPPRRRFANMNLSTASSIASALILALTACSSASDAPDANAAAKDAADVRSANGTLENDDPKASGSPQPRSSTPGAIEVASATPASTRMLSLEGLDALRIGRSVPKGSSWAERGAQESESCRTVTSPDYPGVYAIVSGGKVRRITVGQRSDVKLAEGVGVGATEKDVEKWFAGFREEPHKYEAAPAKYLTAPNAASGDPALRFEMGRDGKVSLMHVGTIPVLNYVEGCS